VFGRKLYSPRVFSETSKGEVSKLAGHGEICRIQRWTLVIMTINIRVSEQENERPDATWLILFFHIREVLALNLGPETVYLDGGLWFFLVPPSK
jgi:hypothetical protein